MGKVQFPPGMDGSNKPAQPETRFRRWQRLRAREQLVREPSGTGASGTGSRYDYRNRNDSAAFSRNIRVLPSSREAPPAQSKPARLHVKSKSEFELLLRRPFHSPRVRAERSPVRKSIRADFKGNARAKPSPSGQHGERLRLSLERGSDI